MSSEDQKLYGSQTIAQTTVPVPELGRHPSPKSSADERKEQGIFANWLLLQNSNGADLPFEWHPLHTRSKTTPGCLDFWLGVGPVSIWIEFKRDHTCALSDAQEEFRRKCEKRGIPTYVVYSAQQAIELVQKADAVAR
jgi:hypothetical protein